MGSEASWVEPTRALPLRWGPYIDRYLAGIVLIIGGGIQLQGSNTWTLPLLLIGTMAYATGWAIMPARGWRRLVAVIPATGQLWLLLTGPLSVWTLVVPYLCWLLVRHRPLRSYVTVLLPLANGMVIPLFFTEYTGMLPALAISLAVFVGSAWLARVIASHARPRRGARHRSLPARRALPRSQRTRTSALPSPSRSR
jgi:hypothetical protein